MNDYDLVKTVVNKLHEKYDTYAHAAGYLESTVVGLLQGESPDDVRRRLNNMLKEMENV